MKNAARGFLIGFAGVFVDVFNWKLSTLAGVAVFFLGFFSGWKFNGNRMEAMHAAERVELMESLREKEKTLQRENAGLLEALEKERENAKKNINDIYDRLRSGRLRLKAGVRVSSGSGAEPGEARAELDAKTSEFLVGIASEGDEAIRELNHCINAYENLRK